MEKPKENKAADARKEPAQTLGISRSIYATGYSFKDGIIWLGIIFVGLWTTLTLGANKAPVRWGAAKLQKFHEWLKNSAGPFIADIIGKICGDRVVKWFENNIGKFFKGPVIALSFSIAYLASHVAMAPGFAHGWKKASTAIDQYNTLAAEKDQLVKTNTVLSEENELLNKKLALQEGRPHADRALASRTAESSAQL